MKGCGCNYIEFDWLGPFYCSPEGDANRHNNRIQYMYMKTQTKEANAMYSKVVK
jgi:hypothetical protein